MRNFLTIILVTNNALDITFFFSRGHATLELAVSVGRSVGRSVGQIFDSRVVFALPLLPNRPRLDCRVSGLVVSQNAITGTFYEGDSVGLHRSDRVTCLGPG